jgi:hypothetical protein
MARIRVQARLRATPAPSSGNAGGGPLDGPYVTQYLQPWPTGDGVTFVFGIYGLAPTDVVAWTASLGEFDFIALDRYDAHTFLVVYQGGDGGSVTATVNGELLGSATYGAPP